MYSAKEWRKCWSEPGPHWMRIKAACSCTHVMAQAGASDIDKTVES